MEERAGRTGACEGERRGSNGTPWDLFDSRWPWALQTGRREEGKGEEEALTPEPKQT